MELSIIFAGIIGGAKSKHALLERIDEESAGSNAEGRKRGVCLPVSPQKRI